MITSAAPTWAGNRAPRRGQILGGEGSGDRGVRRVRRRETRPSQRRRWPLLGVRLEGAEKRDQISALARRETHPEARVVERDHIVQGRRRAVVKVGRAG